MNQASGKLYGTNSRTETSVVLKFMKQARVQMGIERRTETSVVLKFLRKLLLRAYIFRRTETSVVLKYYYYILFLTQFWQSNRNKCCIEIRQRRDFLKETALSRTETSVVLK